MIPPAERYSILTFMPWLLGMLTYEKLMIEEDPDIDPQYINGFVDCLETIKSYTERYMGRKVWGELEADVIEYIRKGLNGKSKKKRKEVIPYLNKFDELYEYEGVLL